MNTESFDTVLDHCIELLRAGASIEDCLARYPQYADELRVELATAQTLLDARPELAPGPSAHARGRARLLEGVAQRRQASERPRGMRALGGMFGRRWRLLPQALPAVLAMLILGGAAWGVAAATSGGPNPGTWFDGSRSRDDRIEFRGAITAIDAVSISISTPSGGQTFQITPDTEFEDGRDVPVTIDAFAVGDFVKVSAFRDESGGLIAREVEHEDDDDRDDREDDRDGDDDHSGPGSPNSGPGNAEDDEDGPDNSGPGNAEDGDDDGDNSGPGSADDGDDDGDNSGPGNAEDDDDDHSGPGNGGDDDDDHSGPGGGGGDDEVEDD